MNKLFRGLWPVLMVTAAGCGEDAAPVVPGPGPGQNRCQPPATQLPQVGHFLDPAQLPLEGCVPGGLGDLPGRWFVVDAAASFSFNYPKFEGSCSQGFTRMGSGVDLDESDGQSAHQWSDGTTFFQRFRISFQFDEAMEPFVYESGLAVCLTQAGTLAATSGDFTSETGEHLTRMTGTRFAAKDVGAKGVTLVGQIAEVTPELPIVGLNVYIEGHHAYVVGQTGLAIVDVADPAAPRAVGSVEGDFNDVRVIRKGDQVAAYLAPLSGQETLVVDVSDPAAPVIAQALPQYSHSLQLATHAGTNYLYLATYGESIPRYDITNPLAPVRVGAVPVPGEISGVHDLFVDGDHIYVNYTEQGLVAVDISAGLGSPIELGRLKTSYSHASWVGTTSPGRRVILHGDEGMTATSDLGAFLRILDGDPASPTYMTEIGRYQSRPEVGIHNFEMVGDRVYIAYYQDGLRIIDIADPTQPQEVAHYNTWDYDTGWGSAFEGAIGVRPVGDLIFVADSARGLLILRED